MIYQQSNYANYILLFRKSLKRHCSEKQTTTADSKILDVGCEFWETIPCPTDNDKDREIQFWDRNDGRGHYWLI